MNELDCIRKISPEFVKHSEDGLSNLIGVVLVYFCNRNMPKLCSDMQDYQIKKLKKKLKAEKIDKFCIHKHYCKVIPQLNIKSSSCMMKLDYHCKYKRSNKKQVDSALAHAKLMINDQKNQ